MRRLVLLAAVVALVGLGGCQKKARMAHADAPRPAASSASMDPLGDPLSNPPAMSTPAPTVSVPIAAEPTSYTPPASDTTSGMGRGTAAVAHASTYTVKKGDTLTGIARQVYGDPRKVRDILNANPGVHDPNRIKVGQTLNLP